MKENISNLPENRRLTVVTDADDVLYNTAQSLVDLAIKEHRDSILKINGRLLTIEDYSENPELIAQKLGISKEEVFGLVLRVQGSSEHVRTLKPIEGARQALTDLKQKYGARVLIATARLESARQGTEDAVERDFPGLIDGVIMTHKWDNMIGDKSFGPSLNKGQICQEVAKQYGAVDIFIDDQSNHCLDVAKVGVKKVILFGDYGWNRDFDTDGTGITRVKNWQESVI